MTQYLVKWAMDVEAPDPETAARVAWKSMQRPGAICNVFDVLTEGQEPVTIDLQEIDNERAAKKEAS